MGWLFAIGSVCFALGSLPRSFNTVGAAAAATTFFVGSLVFTSAGYLQYYLSINAGAEPRRLMAFERLTPDVLASGVQLVGTLFFNISTFAALADNLSVQHENRLIWAPDVFGSIAFLISSAIAFRIAPRTTHGRGRIWWEGAVNLAGSVAFGLSALGAIVLPTTGEPLNLALVNGGTFIGAVGFFIGALLVIGDGVETGAG